MGSKKWPARSLHLTTMDFLCGFLKDKVYGKKPKTIPQLKNFIIEEIEVLRHNQELLKKGVLVSFGED